MHLLYVLEVWSREQYSTSHFWRQQECETVAKVNSSIISVELSQGVLPTSGHLELCDWETR